MKLKRNYYFWARHFYAYACIWLRFAFGSLRKARNKLETNIFFFSNISQDGRFGDKFSHLLINISVVRIENDCCLLTLSNCINCIQMKINRTKIEMNGNDMQL